MPQGVEQDAIKATYRDGVLEVHVPKPQQAKPKKIEIGFDSAGEATVAAPPTIDGAATQK